MASLTADNSPSQEELDLRSYLRPIWRRKWIIVAITVLAAAATYVLSNRQAKKYTASTTLYIQNADPTASITAVNVGAIALSSNQVANAAQLVTGRANRLEVAHKLGVSYAVAGEVSASPSSSSSFVTITATTGNAALAANLANAYASAFLDSRRAEVIAVAQKDLAAAQTTLAELPKGAANVAATLAQRSALNAQISNLKEVILNPSAGAQQVDPAAAPGAPSSPKPKRDAVFGGVLGLLLGIFLAFALELLDRRLMSVATIESIFERPVLAVLPHVADPSPLVDGNLPAVPNGFIEELRSLSVMLRLSGGDKPPKSILVTSTLPSEGKSTVSRDLALVYAEAGQRVLVIDADLRRPSLGRLFGLSSEKGLVQVLRGEATTEEVLVTPAAAAHLPPAHSSNGHSSNGDTPAHPSSNGHHRYESEGGSLTLLLHGERTDNPLALLSTDRMADLIRGAAERYDIVIIDTPPALAVVDGIPLLEIVDAVLVVARLGQTTRSAAERFRSVIARLDGVKFAGVVANDRRSAAEDGYGSYGTYGYYGYSYRHEDKRFGRRRKLPSPRKPQKIGPRAS